MKTDNKPDKSGVRLKSLMRLYGVTAEEVGKETYGNPQVGRQNMSVIFKLPENWYDEFLATIMAIHDTKKQRL